MPSIYTTKLNLKTEKIIGTGMIMMMGISFSVVIGVLTENVGSHGELIRL